MNNNQCSLTCIDLCENNYNNSPATDIKSNKKLKVYQQTVLLGYTMLLFNCHIFFQVIFKECMQSCQKESTLGKVYNWIYYITNFFLHGKLATSLTL